MPRQPLRLCYNGGNEILSDPSAEIKTDPPKKFKDALMAVYINSSSGSNMQWFTTPDEDILTYIKAEVNQYIEVYKRWFEKKSPINYMEADVLFTRISRSKSSPIIIRYRKVHSDRNDIDVIAFAIDHDKFVELSIESLEIWAKTTLGWHIGVPPKVKYGIKLLDADSILFGISEPDNTAYFKKIDGKLRTVLLKRKFIPISANLDWIYEVEFPESMIWYQDGDMFESSKFAKKVMKLILASAISFTIAIFLLFNIQRRKSGDG